MSRPQYEIDEAYDYWKTTPDREPEQYGVVRCDVCGTYIGEDEAAYEDGDTLCAHCYSVEVSEDE